MEPSLTVLTLRNNLVRCLHHVTAVITVKTHSPVIIKYKIPNRCVSLRNCTISSVYSFTQPNLSVLTLRNSLILTSVKFARFFELFDIAKMTESRVLALATLI